MTLRHPLMDTAGDGTGGDGGAGGAGTATAEWHGLPATDADAVAYVKNKGWSSPADVIKSYQGAEKLIGRNPNDLLIVPRADDPVGFRNAMQKLGLPDSPDKYEFDVPKGAAPDENYQKWARETFHKVGLPANVAKALTAEHNAYISNLVKQESDNYQAAVASDKAALQKEWGGGTERMMQAAKTAANALGFQAPVVDAIERAIGYGETMKLFAKLGQRLGEDKFVSGDSSTSGFSDTLTPAEAKAQWDSKLLDDSFKKALMDKSHPGHKAAKEQQAKLFSIMYPS